MRNKMLTLLLLTCVCAAATVAGLAADDDAKKSKDPQQTLMRAKLVHSQEILGAIALEDFDGVLNGATQLKLLSLDAGWQVLQTEEYVRQSKDFRRATDALVAAAGRKNLDGAVLAYFQLTQSCVSCHKYVRDQQ